jgi:uncharacterized membrane protein
VLAVAPVALGVVVIATVAIRTGQSGGRLPASEGGEQDAESGVVQRDDDRFWRAGGGLYVNRADPAVLVPKRFGFGWTFNFGNPRGLLLMAAIVVLPICLSLLTR